MRHFDEYIFIYIYVFHSKSHLSLAKLSLLHLALEQATHTHLTQQHIAHYPVQPRHLPVEMLTPTLGEEMQHSVSLYYSSCIKLDLALD